MRKNVKGFIAKLLVLCMVAGLLPVVALATEVAHVSDGGRATAEYTITADTATGGSAYVVKSDTTLHKLDSSAYTMTGDTTIRLVPDGGYEVVWGNATNKTGSYYTYTANSSTNSVYITGNDTTIVKANHTAGTTFKVYPVFTATSSGGDPVGPGGGGGGGGGGSSSGADKVTVEEPVTGGGTTTVEVKVETGTSGTTTTATVSQKDMDKAVDSAVKAAEEAGTAPALEVKVETSGEATAVNVNLPVKSLEALAQAEGATLSITSDVANIALDSASTAALAEQATGSTVTLAVKPAALNSAQAEAVKDATVIDVSVTSGGQQITSFGGGVLTISVKYTPSGGVTAANVQVYYLTDKGNLLCHDTSYSGGSLTFTTTHLSKFVIGTKSMMAVFADVSVNTWYAEAVKYVYDNGLMVGVESGKFAPDAAINRAMVVTVLYRMEGEPNAGAGGDFTDVAAGQWYTDAVAWAAANGIVGGYGNGKFGPMDTMTREQLATVMYRYAKYKGLASDASANLSGYTDAGQIHDWALDAMKWANGTSLINGTSSTTLSPGGSSTRAQLAAILMRYCEKIV